MTNNSDPDKVLRQIWESRTSKGIDYRDASERERETQLELRALAIALHEANFLRTAEAIAGYLLGETSSLDQAFGLKGKPGAPPRLTTLRKDADALEGFLQGTAIETIATNVGMLEIDVQRLCDGTGKFFKRRQAAFAEILCRRLDEK